jgi:3-hydroxymyristoyl/3-hydroxydecanoyl-(acyl carrier protein) dehydratase
MTEDYLQYHFPRRPTMPGVLLLESMAQLAGWLEAISSDFTCWFLLEHVKSCKFYELTVPATRSKSCSRSCRPTSPVGDATAVQAASAASAGWRRSSRDS